jgi:hypothetical protein
MSQTLNVDDLLLNYDPEFPRQCFLASAIASWAVVHSTFNAPTSSSRSNP